MKPLLLALRLRVPTDAQWCQTYTHTHQPDLQRGPTLRATAAPRRAVVAQHRAGQSVTTEQRCQMVLNRDPGFVTARDQAQGIAAMIVQHGQRMTAAAIHRDVTLEVHLPQLVRRGPLETLERPVFERLRRVKPAVTAQNLRHRRGRRHPHDTQIKQPARQFATAPGRVRVTQRDNLSLDPGIAARRAAQRTPRTICEPGLARLRWRRR